MKLINNIITDEERAEIDLIANSPIALEATRKRNEETARKTIEGEFKGAIRDCLYLDIPWETNEVSERLGIVRDSIGVSEDKIGDLIAILRDYQAFKELK